MSTILLTWESGGGLGHLLQMMPLATALVKRGHRVHVALRNLSSAAAEVFGRAGDSGVRSCSTPGMTFSKRGGEWPGATGCAAPRHALATIASAVRRARASAVRLGFAEPRVGKRAGPAT
jgi:hypothetical protein